MRITDSSPRTSDRPRKSIVRAVQILALAATLAIISCEEPLTVECLTVPRDTLILYAAVDRPGTYSVLVRSPGYSDWLRTTVDVTADACHVRTVTLTARLLHS